MADAAALAIRAKALHQAGQLPEAARAYAAALAARPAPSLAAELTGLLGALRVQQGDPAAGAKLLRRAAQLRPGDAGLRYNLGIALLRQAQAAGPGGTAAAEAAEAFAAVTRLDPTHAEAWKQQGDALRGLGRPAGAMAAYRAALAHRPDHAAARGNLAGQLNQAGAATEAEALLRAGLALRPAEPLLLNNLGQALRLQSRLTEAEAAFRAALAARPGYAIALENLANVLVLQGRATAAEPLLAEAVAHTAQPGGSLLGAWLGVRTMLCLWDGLDALRDRVLASPPEDPPEPFELLWHPVPPARFRRVAAAHARAMAAPLLAAGASTTAPPAIRPAEDRLRLGYLSADFQDHATAWLLAEVLERHDRAAFAVHAYSLAPDDGGAMRPRLRAAVEHFREVGGPATAIAGAIAADGLDLLVDLKGWTRGNRLEALALRPAPVQALWLGFPATTGAPWIDYHIVDAVVVPPGCEADFSEKLIRLPHCYQPVDSRRAMAAAGHRAEHGLPDSALVLACFCQSAKITAEVFASWLRLLAALPDAVLWLLQPEAAVADRLRALAAAAGLDPARLFFGPPLPQAAHLARYTLADLALETFPCGSHTTASDALWAGCPQVAITGDSFVSRVSTSVVRAAGLPELAVDSVAAAEALVLRLGRDRAALAALRARVANARAAPLFDAGRFTRDLEAAFRMMVREK